MHNGDPVARWPMNPMVPEVSGRCTAKHDEWKEVSQEPDVEAVVAALEVSDNFSAAVEMQDQVRPFGETFYHHHQSQLVPEAFELAFHLSPLPAYASVRLHVSTAGQCRVLPWRPFLPAR